MLDAQDLTQSMNNDGGNSQTSNNQNHGNRKNFNKNFDNNSGGGGGGGGGRNFDKFNNQVSVELFSKFSFLGVFLKKTKPKKKNQIKFSTNATISVLLDGIYIFLIT